MAESSETPLQTTTVSSPGAPQASPSTKIVRLQVGERSFNTSIETLKCDCDFFTAYFSGRWELEHQPDGSLFFDWDGDVFAHVLSYQRSKVLPILYSSTDGFDYALYTKILQLADYLGIAMLASWIRDNKFLNTIKLNRQCVMRNESHSVSGDVKSTIHPEWEMGKVYVCPRGIYSHYGDKKKCGYKCQSTRGDGGDEYRDKIVGVKMWCMEEQTVFERRRCWNENGDLL